MTKNDEAAKKGKGKSKFVGVRMSDDQAELLGKLTEQSNMSKSGILLKGLEYVGEMDQYGLDTEPLSDQLRSLEQEAMKYAVEMKSIRQKREAIASMVKEFKEIDIIIDSYGGDESALVQIMLDVQKKYNWLPKHALLWISERMDVPMARIISIATFYKAFSLEPKGKHQIRVCLGTACHVREGPKVVDAIKNHLGIEPGQTTRDMSFSLETVNCLGCCALGPVMLVDDTYHGNLTPAKVPEILKTYEGAN